MAERKGLDPIHHFAIPVKDIDATLEWYQNQARCVVLYHDTSWALLQFDNVKLAFVNPEQHPTHVAFQMEDAEKYGELKPHRDGTKSVYLSDPSGNAVEILSMDKAFYEK
jgi:catechol 2,3-dioxygenase-like lactoylglutathione lyase family enzyme